MSTSKLLITSCVFLVISVKADEFTTVKTYTMERPDLDTDPITIIEGDPLWNEKTFMTNFETLQTTSPASTNLFNPLTTTSEEATAEFSATALREFLENYAEKIKREKFGNINKSLEMEEDKRKSNGNSNNLKQYVPPYEDKAGWVSLEPIPWSVSQISKWHSKPTNPPEEIWNHYLDESAFDAYDRPDVPKPNRYTFKPQINTNKFQPYESDDSDQFKNVYKNKFPVYNSDFADQFKNVYKRPFLHQKRPQPQYSAVDSEVPHKSVIIKNDIITDGLSPNFPKYPTGYNRRHGTELHSEPEPFTGNGNWVLLSTSKGYKYPKRQRAIQMKPEHINTHKSVQLTVLPPLKDSKINMTTSHGGLLQVESTFEPVEQAQRKFKRLQKIKNKQNKRKRPNHMRRKNKLQTVQPIKNSIPRSTGDGGAVLAGVGAGLIPATMAMMVPLVMNGKKRKKRSTGAAVLPERLSLIS